MKALITATLLAASTALAWAGGEGTATPSAHLTAGGLYHNVFAPANKAGIVKMILCKPQGSASTRLSIYGPSGRLEYSTLVRADSALRTFDMKDMETGTYRFEFTNGGEKVVDEVVVN